MSKFTVLLCILTLGAMAIAQQPPQSHLKLAPPPDSLGQSTATRTVTAYTLPPDVYKKAHELHQVRFRMLIFGFVYALVVLWLILRWKVAARCRDWAEKASLNRFLQSLIFSPLLLLTIAVWTLPLDIYGEWVERRYGISIEGWSAWTLDWIKAELVTLVLGTLFIWLLYIVIRRSGHRWWFYFWLIALPIALFVTFLQPLLIDPMFNKFEPLQKTNPVLTARLVALAERAHENIPAERIFWMGAGEKTTGLNAYVTGIGASKRIVVWDTTIAKMSTPQIVFVAGHEMGHYALQHIPKGIAFAAVFSLVIFYLAYRLVGWMLLRWGRNWAIRGLEDWASLPVLLLLFSLFVFAGNPVGSAFSCHYEHQADEYGLEVTHGLTPDSGQVAAQAFQILGETTLADPDPDSLDVFLFYSHEPIAKRIQFSLSYEPWATDAGTKFVK